MNGPKRSPALLLCRHSFVQQSFILLTGQVKTGKVVGLPQWRIQFMVSAFPFSQPRPSAAKGFVWRSLIFRQPPGHNVHLKMNETLMTPPVELQYHRRSIASFFFTKPATSRHSCHDYDRSLQGSFDGRHKCIEEVFISGAPELVRSQLVKGLV